MLVAVLFVLNVFVREPCASYYPSDKGLCHHHLIAMHLPTETIGIHK
jgi:hypothetical protein